MRKTLLYFACTILISTFTLPSFAQVEWGLKGFENRGRGHTMFYLGYNYPMGSLKQTMSESFFDEFTGKISNTEIGKNYTATSTMGGVIGWSQQIARLTEVSALTADLAIMYNQMTYNTGKVSYGSNQSFNYDIALTQISIPIGVTVLRGPDAIKDKSFRMSYGIGLGVAPTQTSATFGAYDNSVWNYHPYAKGEIGFFAGILFKFRALVNFGNTQLFEHNADTYAKEPLIETTNSRLTLGTTTNLQFIIYPFSMGYAKSQWWR